MHPALQVPQPAEGCALSSADDRRRIFPFTGNPGQSYTGARTAGPASAAHVLPDPGSLSSCRSSRSGSSPLTVSRFPLRLPGQGWALTARSDPHTPPLLREGKPKRRLLPESVRVAAALLAGARALVSSAVSRGCSLTAQKPAAPRGRRVAVGRGGCVSWIASEIVLCFNRPERLKI